MEYTGTIKVIKDTQKISETFKKREFVVTDGAAQYPQTVQFESTQDRCDLLDNVAVGDEVNIKFNLKGREWKNPQGEVRVFNTLQAWAIVKVKKEGTKKETLTPTPDDDLPF